MGRRTTTVTEFFDDVDGSKAVETISFAVGGTTYEIDLSRKNAKALHADLAKWMEHARKTKGRRRSSTTSRRRTAPAGDAATIRTWAAANGVDLPARGRIPVAVREQYEAAH